MVDWNALMRESLTKMMPLNQEKRKKSFFDACNKTKTNKIVKILEENKITNVGKNTPYGRDEAMEISRRQSKKNKEERTLSEKMQDKLEPIPCPMNEDYDDKKDNV